MEDHSGEPRVRQLGLHLTELNNCNPLINNDKDVKNILRMSLNPFLFAQLAKSYTQLSKAIFRVTMHKGLHMHNYAWCSDYF